MSEEFLRCETMQEEMVLKKIKDILINKIDINPVLISKDNYDEPLTGKVFKLTGRELLYIFLEVEKNFKLNIDVHTILNYEFNSINGIKEYIMNASKA